MSTEPPAAFALSVERLLEQILEELKPYDLVGEKKETVTSTKQEKIVNIPNFKLVICTPDGADMYISLSEIGPSSFKVFNGSAYCMTKRKKKVDAIYAQAVSGSGTLRMSFWK